MSGPGRHFGHPPGVRVGDRFPDRQALRAAGVHRPPRTGISGTALGGADSIVLSGAYEDDRDQGDVLIYTGQGGRDAVSGQQVAHQTLTRSNLALVVSERRGLPVRVTRGPRFSPHAPKAGYRYGGLYRVTAHWQETGRSGYRIWRFRLERWVGEGSGPDSLG